MRRQDSSSFACKRFDLGQRTATGSMSSPDTKKAVRLDCCSCGGRTRTCDLQVMSLASYQLLHSAILP